MHTCISFTHLHACRILKSYISCGGCIGLCATHTGNGASGCRSCYHVSGFQNGRFPETNTIAWWKGGIYDTCLRLRVVNCSFPAQSRRCILFTRWGEKPRPIHLSQAAAMCAGEVCCKKKSVSRRAGGPSAAPRSAAPRPPTRAPSLRPDRSRLASPYTLRWSPAAERPG